ncbi:uncharacterized protein PAC_00658 [Phialocephala subalpina]|uniref:Uncharacterized protein n=1 Tax=Phialocephala subalpina TaxID=576137 RepID=A0A1L7WDB9_9HELO|nr:uncharacterized protein PAC_00658 [Phialocephala subalpina]
MVFYLGQKACLYLFLVERTFSVNKNLRPRMKDWIYLSGLVLVIVVFSALGSTTFVCNIADYDEENRICHIGLTRPIVIAMLLWDKSIYIFLTAVFLKCCRPYMVKGYRSTSSRSLSEAHARRREEAWFFLTICTLDGGVYHPLAHKFSSLDVIEAAILSSSIKSAHISKASPTTIPRGARDSFCTSPMSNNSVDVTAAKDLADRTCEEIRCGGECQE